MVALQAFCGSAFASVGEAFARFFRELDETGAATCVYQHGVPVVDLWAGLATSSTASASPA
jgi:hypothetical protein